ncbi:MAG: hypothetical protein ICV74_08030 [Thermoleophilia bacterium]|nr:hypothetical protein [Thermoleophilia bacterium]
MSTANEPPGRLQQLLAELEAALATVEGSADADAAVDGLARMSDLASEVQAEIDRLRRETGDA